MQIDAEQLDEVALRGTETLEALREGYTIRIAARMTGLSVDTLRMWERRYGFPSPNRNGVGNRIYREADVERLALIARAMKMGYRISEAIRLNDSELTGLLANQVPSPIERTGALGRDMGPLIALLKDGDPDALSRTLRRLAVDLGARSFITDVATPLVESVGLAWASGTLQVHQEHVFTQILSTELALLTALLDNHIGPRLLLGTLPRERHGLGLQMVSVYASVAGAKVHNLGIDVPTLELVRAATALRAQAIGLSVSLGSAPTAAIEQVSWLATNLPPTVELWLGGKGASALEGLPNRVRVLANWDDLELAVTGLRRGL